MTTTAERTSLPVPVLFQVHDGEATGTVLPFCGTKCRDEYEPDEAGVAYSTGTGSTGDFGDGDIVCTGCSMELTVAAYVERIMAEVDEKVELGFVHYDERLSDEAIQKCLDGDRNAADDDVDDSAFEARAFYARECITEACTAAGLDMHDLGAEVTAEVRERVQDRDEFDAFGGLLHNTGRRMFRLKIADPSSDGDHLYGGTYWDSSDKDRKAEAKKIAKALGWGKDTHEFILGILAETSYAGTHPSILWYGSVAPIVEALSVQEFEESAAHTITFDAGDAAALLMWDGMNGAGYEENPLPAGVTLPLRHDLIDLDHKAGPGWSYSDDVAGLVYSAFEADPTIVRVDS